MAWISRTVSDADRLNILKQDILRQERAKTDPSAVVRSTGERLESYCLSTPWAFPPTPKDGAA
jgi:hypothetical protein